MENEQLIDSKEMQLHTMQLKELYTQLKTTERGLSSLERKKRRREEGNTQNEIPNPLNAPEWLCCLLPCLMSTPSMIAYRECVADHNDTFLDNDYVNVNCTGLLRGDKIKVEKGRYVGADIRVVFATPDCMVDTIYITGKTEPMKVEANVCDQIYEKSPNICFLGYKVISGYLEGIVIGTGHNTVIARMIKRGEFPPAAVMNRK